MVGVEAVFFDFLLSLLFSGFPGFSFLPKEEQAKNEQDNGSNRYDDGNSNCTSGRQSTGF
jgi:hypothetical protein